MSIDTVFVHILQLIEILNAAKVFKHEINIDNRSQIYSAIVSHSISVRINLYVLLKMHQFAHTNLTIWLHCTFFRTNCWQKSRLKCSPMLSPKNWVFPRWQPSRCNLIGIGIVAGVALSTFCAI